MIISFFYQKLVYLRFGQNNFRPKIFGPKIGGAKKINNLVPGNFNKPILIFFYAILLRIAIQKLCLTNFTVKKAWCKNILHTHTC